uniref:C2H2-type domain-containing protein n=1 Tax=Stomoxys calcitrans TaxID=35570 RepID=A0A1I8NV81_STOCA
MTDAQYEAKFKEMQKYIPFIQKVIEKLKVNNDQQGDNPRKAQLQKMEMLYGLLTNQAKKLKMETLLKCEGVLIKLHAKIEKHSSFLQNEESETNSAQAKTTSKHLHSPSTSASSSSSKTDKSKNNEKNLAYAPASPSPELIADDNDEKVQPVVIPTERRLSEDKPPKDRLSNADSKFHDHKSRLSDSRPSQHYSHKQQRSTDSPKLEGQRKSHGNRAEDRKTQVTNRQDSRNDVTKAKSDSLQTPFQRRSNVDTHHQLPTDRSSSSPLSHHHIAKDLHNHSAMKHLQHQQQLQQHQHQQQLQQNVHSNSKPPSSSSSSVLQKVKVVITEPLPENLAKRHFPPHHQHLYQQPSQNSPPLRDPQRCLHKIDINPSQPNDEAYNPDESWEKYNEVHNSGHKNKSTTTGVFNRLGEKLPDDKQTGKPFQSLPIAIPPGRNASIPDVLKSPPLSASDINNLLRESGADYVPPDISEIGTRRPKKPTSEDPTNSLDYVRKKFAQIAKLGSPHTRDSTSPSLETQKGTEHSASPGSSSATLTCERLALKYNPHPRQERLQSLSSNEGSECSHQSASRIPNDPRLKAKINLPPAGVNVLPSINAHDPRLKRQAQLNASVNSKPLPPTSTTAPVTGRNDPRVARQFCQTSSEPIRRPNVTQPNITPEENWDTDPEDNGNTNDARFSTQLKNNNPMPVTSTVIPAPFRNDPRIARQLPKTSPEPIRTLSITQPNITPEENWDTDPEDNGNKNDARLPTHVEGPQLKNQEAKPLPVAPPARRKSMCQTAELSSSGSMVSNPFVPKPSRNVPAENWNSNTEPINNNNNNNKNKCDNRDNRLPWDKQNQPQVIGPMRRKSVCQPYEDHVNHAFIPNAPKHDFVGNWNTNTNLDQGLVRNSPSAFVAFNLQSKQPTYLTNPFVGNMQQMSNNTPSPPLASFPAQSSSFMHSTTSASNRFNSALNDSLERIRYFQSKKPKQQQPRTYKEFKEAKERALALDAANKRDFQDRSNRKIEETEAAKKKASEENSKKISESQDKNKSDNNKQQEKCAVTTTNTSESTSKTPAGESTLDKMYRTQNFTTEFPKASLSFKIPKKKTEENVVTKPPDQTKPASKKLDEKNVSSGVEIKSNDKTKEKPKATNNNEGKSNEAAGQKTKKVAAAPPIEVINAPNPPKGNDSEENWDSETESDANTQKDNCTKVNEKANMEKTNEKPTNLRDPRCRAKELSKQEENDTTNAVDSSAEHETTTENLLSKTKASLGDNDNSAMFPSSAEFKPQRIMRRRCTMVPTASAPLVDKGKLLKANALMLEDVEEREKLMKKKEEKEREVIRRNKNLEEMFQKTDDNCTVSTQNIITGKRRTRTTINFNETQNAINVFKHLSKKEAGKTARCTKTKTKSNEENSDDETKNEAADDSVENASATKDKEENKATTESVDKNKAVEDEKPKQAATTEEKSKDGETKPLVTAGDESNAKTDCDKQSTEDKGKSEVCSSDDKAEKEKFDQKDIKNAQEVAKPKFLGKKMKKLAIKLPIVRNKKPLLPAARRESSGDVKGPDIENENLVEPEQGGATEKPTEDKQEETTSLQQTSSMAEEQEHQICAVSSTSADATPAEEECSTTVDAASLKEEVDDNEPSSSGSKSITHTPTPPEDESSRHVFLNEFVQEMIKPSADKQHILNLLGKILSNDELQVIKSAIDTAAKNHNDEEKEPNGGASKADNKKPKADKKIKAKRIGRPTKPVKKEVESPDEEEENHVDDEEDRKAPKSGRNTPNVKKKRNELDRLNEDIRDMFICEGVLTATGKRMCTLMNEKNKNKKTEMEKPTNKRFVQPTTSSKLKAESDSNLKRRSGRLKQTDNVTPTTQQPPLRRSLRGSKAAIDANDEATTSDQNSNDTTPTRRKMPVLKPHTPIKLPEEQNVEREKEEEDEEIFTPENKRKTLNKPCPKSKKAKLSNDPMKDSASENESNSEDEQEAEEEETTTNNEVEAIKNTNVHWHNQSKHTSWCVLCSKKLPATSCSSHYKLNHGESYISRLAPILVQKFKQGKLSKPMFGVGKNNKTATWFYRCPFCLKYFNTTMPRWLDHFQSHTAEFQHECSKCRWGSNRLRAATRHIKNNCASATIVNSPVQTRGLVIKAHVCHLCNFLQIKRENLERHYIEQHQLGHKNVDLLGYTITLFDYANVELVPEDKALAREKQAREIIAKEEEVIDIDDDNDNHSADAHREINEKENGEKEKQIEEKEQEQEVVNETDKDNEGVATESTKEVEATTVCTDDKIKQAKENKKETLEAKQSQKDVSTPQLENEHESKRLSKKEVTSETNSKVATPLRQENPQATTAATESPTIALKSVATLMTPPRAQIASTKTISKNQTNTKEPPQSPKKMEGDPLIIVNEGDVTATKMLTPKKANQSSAVSEKSDSPKSTSSSSSVQIAAKKYTIVLSGHEQGSLKEVSDAKANLRPTFNCQIINEDYEAKEVQDELLSLAALAAEEQVPETQLTSSNSRDVQDELLNLAAEAAKTQEMELLQLQESEAVATQPCETRMSDLISDSIDMLFKRNKRKSNEAHEQMDNNLAKKHCPPTKASNVFVSSSEVGTNSPPIQILASSIVNIDLPDKAVETSNKPMVTSMAERLSQRLKGLQETAKSTKKDQSTENDSHTTAGGELEQKQKKDTNKSSDKNEDSNEEVTVISDDEEWEDIEITESAPNSGSTHNSSHLQKNKNRGIFQKFGIFKGNAAKSKKSMPPLLFYPKKKSSKEKPCQPQSNSSSPITIKSAITDKSQASSSPLHNVGFKPVINIMDDLLPDSPCNDPIDLVPELTPLEPLTDLNDISSILDSNLSATVPTVGLQMDESHTCIQDALDFISEQTAQEKQSDISLKATIPTQSKNVSTSQIQNVGYSQKDNNVKFYCLLDNCSFLFSSDAVGLENHFLCEHAQIKWKGYCTLCQEQCFANDREYSITKEIKHMVDRHINRPVIEPNSDSSQHSTTNTGGQGGGGEERPRIKLRRMTGDCLSTSNSESPTPSSASAPASAATGVPQSNTLLGALLNAKPKPPTIDMPPQPEMPLTEPLLIDDKAFRNVGNEFVITSVASAAQVMEDSSLQIASVVSLNQEEEPHQLSMPKIAKVCTLSSKKSGNIWAQQIEEERQELLESRAASLEVSNILANAHKSATHNKESTRRSQDDSPGPIVVAETVPVGQATAGDFVITQTVSTQYGGNSSSASVGFNICIQPSMLANISVASDKEPQETLAVTEPEPPPQLLNVPPAGIEPGTPTVTSRQYKCMANGCKFTSRVPVAMSDHLRFHERRNLSTKCDYFSCAFCLYQASDVEDYMKHSDQFHIISKTNKLTTSMPNDNEAGSSPASRNICDILSKKMETSNANRNALSAAEMQRSLVARQKETEEEYHKKLRATIEEIVGPTGFPDDKLYRCVIKNCRTQLTENTFHNHIMYHISTLGVANPNNYVFKCPHCSAQYHRPAGIKAHIKNHARNRYFCYLCEETSANPGQMLKHFSDKHWHTLTMFTKELLKAKVVTNADGTEQIQDACYYLVYTSDLSDADVRKYGEKLILEWQRKKSGSKTHFKSSEIELLPIPPIYQREVNCGECEYKTKVRTNMYRHLLMHKQNAHLPNNTGQAVVASVDPVNPVPCLNSNERFFDKMTNLASSSLIPSSQSTSNAGVKSAKIPYVFVEEAKRFRCGISDCNYVNISEDIFRSHLSTLHGTVMSYRCPFCQEDICKRGMAVDRVLGHLRFHGPTLHVCEECNYSHYQRYVVERHINDKHASSKVNILKYERNEDNTEGVVTTTNYVGKKYKDITESNNSAASTAPMTTPATRSSTGSEPSCSSASSSGNAKTKSRWICDVCKHTANSLAQIQTHCQNAHGCKLPYQCKHCPFGSHQLSQILCHIDGKHPTQSRSARYIYHKLECEGENDVADTRPLWQRNDPKRIRHIRGILMEDEEESEKYRKKMGLDKVVDDEDENEDEDVADTSGQNFLKGFEFGCYHCDYKSQKFDELYCTHYKNAHSVSVESTKPFMFRLLRRVCCPECRKFTGNFYELQLHLPSAHNVRLYYAADISIAENEDNSQRLLCGYCSFHCSKPEHLKRHFRTAKSQHLPQDIRIESNYQMLDILKVGKPETYYQCTLCSQLFGNRVSIVQHAVNFHTNDESSSFKELSNSVIYCCPLCPFYAATESTLLRHMIDHCGNFKRCYFCNAPQVSFEHCMQHCYAEHREEMRRFREIFTSEQIKQFFMQMFILFPNGLIINKQNLKKTEYGSDIAIEEYYEEMYKISQQPPIPRLSIARLVARKSIEAKQTSANSSPQYILDISEEVLPTPIPISSKSQPKKITKRRCTVMSAGREETTLAAARKNGTGAKRKSSFVNEQESSLNQSSEFNVPMVQAMRIKKRRCTIASDPNDKASTSPSLCGNSPQPYMADNSDTTLDTSKLVGSSSPSALEYVSHYGIKPEAIDLSKIYTKVAIGGINTPLTIDKFRQLFNIDCQLKLTKCDVSNVPQYAQYKHIKKACPASHKFKFS